MKKNRNIFIALNLFIISLLFIGNVNAKPTQRWVALCTYDKSVSGANSISWNTSEENWGGKLDGTSYKGNYTTAFKNKVIDDSGKFVTFKSNMNEKQLENFVCPAVACAYKGANTFFVENTSKMSSCPSKYDSSRILFGKYDLNDTKKIDFSIFSDINDTFFTKESLTNTVKGLPDTTYYNNDQINGQWTTSKQIISTNVAASIYDQVKEKYGFPKEKPLPKFLQKYITERLKDDQNASQILTDAFNEKANADHDAGIISDETFQEKTDAVNNNYDWGSGTGYTITKEYRETVDTSLGTTAHEPTTEVDCNSILGGDMTKLVQNALKFIRFLGPVLVIIFTIIEFVGAVFSADASLTKPLGRLIRRLIAAALLFFLPTIIIPLFNYLHITMSDTCMSFLQ